MRWFISEGVHIPPEASSAVLRSGRVEGVDGAGDVAQGAYVEEGGLGYSNRGRYTSVYKRIHDRPRFRIHPRFRNVYKTY